MTELHFMIDLETMGTGADAPIMAIGVQVFDPIEGTLGNTFYRGILLASNGDRPIDPNTVEWWLDQSKSAQGALLSGERINLACALMELDLFMEAQTRDKWLASKDIQIWSNGPTFDEVIIRHAFGKKRFPVSFRGSRCCRTMSYIARTAGLEATPHSGVAHSALGDATHQAELVIAAFKHLGLQNGN